MIIVIIITGVGINCTNGARIRLADKFQNYNPPPKKEEKKKCKFHNWR